LALGLFAAVQTFVFFARRDRFAVLFWWTSESWLLVTLLWLKDLALAAAAFFVFFRIARWTDTLPRVQGRWASSGDVIRTRVQVRGTCPRDDSGVRHALLFAGILAFGVETSDREDREAGRDRTSDALRAPWARRRFISRRRRSRGRISRRVQVRRTYPRD
jgi:hypothetical protein